MTARVRRPGRVFMKRAEAMPQEDDFHQRIRALEALPLEGVALHEIKVFEDDSVVVVGDGAFYWPIPNDLNDSEIIYADGGVSTPSSGGTIEVQIAHQSLGVGGYSDILSTKISIAAGDEGATPGVVTGGAFGPVASVGKDKDWLRIDVDSSGSGAMGLVVMVGFTPSPLGSLAVQGAQGPPGGITTFTGTWSAVTVYVAGQAVSNNGSSYVALQPSTNVEPGVTPGWEAFWMLLAGGEQLKTSALEVNMSGGRIGYVLDIGVKAGLHVPFACTIVEATLLADLSGDLVVDIWSDTYGNYPPTVADSICGGNKPTLTGAIKTTDTTLVGWDTALSAGDELLFYVESCVTITRALLALTVERN